MTRIAYVDGRYVPYAQAAVHCEDRGFQFADAVYEVCEIAGGNLVDEARHIDRLGRSLNAIGMDLPMSRAALAHVMRQVIRRNRVHDGTVYLQVSRGAAPRDFFVPDPPLAPTVVIIARPLHRARLDAQAVAGIAVVTMPDIRWKRCDIKSVMLLPACLAKAEAKARGAREAWLVDEDGMITEGASSNAWIVDQAGVVVTRPLTNAILGGVTRASLFDALQAAGIRCAERAFSVGEARAAAEAFITSASGTVMPVVAIDGIALGDGRPGPTTRRLRELFPASAARTPVRYSAHATIG